MVEKIKHGHLDQASYHFELHIIICPNFSANKCWQWRRQLRAWSVLHCPAHLLAVKLGTSHTQYSTIHLSPHQQSVLNRSSAVRVTPLPLRNLSTEHIFKRVWPSNHCTKRAFPPSTPTTSFPSKWVSRAETRSKFLVPATSLNNPIVNRTCIFPLGIVLFVSKTCVLNHIRCPLLIKAAAKRTPFSIYATFDFYSFFV